MNLAVIYILISVVGGAIGQLLLKKGMNNLGEMTLTVNELGSMLWRMATNPFVFFGLLIYVISVVFWLVALSRVDLSYAYPFASLSYIIMLIASWLLFNEHISLMRIIGTLVICVGVWLIYRS
jgi:drug/metabolite transporter (DMT)-like permease